MKKKIMICLVSIGILIGILFLIYEKKYVLNSNSEMPKNISLFVMGEDGNYSASTKVPTGNYLIDEENSYCEGKGTFSDYDSSKGTIKYTVAGQDECIIYFEKGLPILSDTILAKADGTVRNSNQENGGTYVIKQETVEYNGTTYDAGVRYEGLDPDNYVTFNGNEEWRIIGVFEGSTIGLEPGKQYTKIIKSTKLPTDYAWNCDDHNGDGDCYDTGESENDWTNSTLNTYLNDEYLSSLTGSDKIATYNGNYSTWYLRGTSSYGDGTYDSAKWYLAERITGTPGYKDEVAGAALPETRAAIGLMYPSDYGYGAYGSACDNAPYKDLNNYDYGCAAVDYLATDSISNGDHEWLISPRPDYSDFAFAVRGNSDGLLDYTSVSYANAVRPVLYLEASVGINKGEGTKDNPYILK